MKLILTAIVLALLAGSISLLAVKWSEKSDVLLAMACGNPSDDGTLELGIMVGMLMTKVDPPALDAEGRPLWNDWVDDHFQLRDAAGTAVAFRRAMRSAVIPPLKTGGVEEFFLTAKLKAGEAYTLEHIPVVGENKQYSKTFTAEPIEFIRTRLAIVK